MREVDALEEVHRTKNYYRPTNAGVVKGDMVVIIVPHGTLRSTVGRSSVGNLC